MAVPFRLDAVLRIRESERDVCRLSLAEAQRTEAALIVAHQQVTSDRESALQELRTMQQQEAWSADRVAAWQQHAELLSTKLKAIECEQATIAELITCKRQSLIEADTAVKALEKLAGRHATEQQRADEASAERERDDNRRAA